MDTLIVDSFWHLKVQHLTIYEVNLTLKMDIILMFFILALYLYPKIYELQKIKLQDNRCIILNIISTNRVFLLSTFYCFTVSDY